MTTTYTDAQISLLVTECEHGPSQAAVRHKTIARVLRSLLTERQAAMQGQGGEAIELPDNIRVPLDEVIADLGYLFGRVAADGSFMKAAMDSTRLKLESARKAIVAALQPPQPVRSVSDEDVEAACRKYYNCGHPVYPPVFEAMRAALEHFASIAQEKQRDSVRRKA